MKKNIPILIINIILAVCLFSNIFAYPIFSNQTNITQKDQQKIDDYNETELYPQDNTITQQPEPEPQPQPEPEPEPEPQPQPQPEPEPQQITVGKLDWFNTVHKQFKTYTKTRVIDIYSGKTYYVYRDGGHYHADVEPINKENTQIFFSIYNFEWSWERRPVWVEISPDLWTAASINGYPHGNSYVKNTGMDGHTCIHFLNSKTHGTKRVCPVHQECINYAYEHQDQINKTIN